MEEEKKTDEEVKKEETNEELKTENEPKKESDKKEEQKLEQNEEKDEKLEEQNQKATNDEINELNDRYKRLFAEFENYKKRTQKESLTKRAEITAEVVTEVLPIVDNLEKAVEVKIENDSYQEGIKLILKQLYDVLKKFGMEEIETVGTTFDPALHDAVQHVEDQEKGSGEIVKEYRKGYRIGTKVVRHAMVVVAN